MVFKIFLLISLSALALGFIDIPTRKAFINFQLRFAKSYDSQEEFDTRLKIFSDNLKRNAELSKLNPRATFGVNKFSDLSQEEFAQQYLMKFDPSEYVRPAVNATALPRAKNVRQCNPDPDNFNWGSCGATTPVYNQGQCGSCWAFSATETIESYYYLQGGPLTQLSMEQIVDCDTSDDGCNGGFPYSAYQYVESAGGIDSYASYPYTAESGNSGTCQFSSTGVVATVTSYANINGESGLYQQLSSSSGGPVSVCVDASTWQSYTGGVLESCPDNIDHCVQAVGYGQYNGQQPYWIVRNSWGASWGLEGFIWIGIGNDLCGIGDYATVVAAASA